ncbi:MAG: ATP-binding protein [Saprospiraceae bacterium]|nr:ATP-binding protein [Saprospiraceae bacterium]
MPHRIKHIHDVEGLRKAYLKLAVKEKYFRIINEFAVNLLDKQTVDDIVWAVAKNAIAKMGFVDCVIYLLDPQTGMLEQKAAHGPKNPSPLDIKNPILIPIGQGIVGTVAATGQGEVINDTSKDDRYILDDQFRHSEITIPIKMNEQVIGVIDSEHPDKDFFTKEDFDILTTIAAMTATKLMNARATEKIKSHQKHLEREIELKTKHLQKTITELEQSKQDIESFAYAAAHDLQEPLRTIASYLQLLDRKLEGQMDPKSKHFLHTAINGATRMKKLLEGILNYSDLMEGIVPFEKVDLNEVIREVQEALAKKIATHQAIIQYKELPTIHGIHSQIMQLFQNLISNSIKFRKAGSNPIISISAKAEKGRWMIHVTDNGIGIEMAKQDKVFKIFSRLHHFKDYPGHGIGLALCKRIVELHHGQITIKSTPGQGTTFSFDLPEMPTEH